ncbi:MAG: site-specific integrase [Planctomycetes bacterium]|nr:site-specific integrase [Planctomycetota bacterium]MCW8134244.1 site-specific integrase [Planctomycetota bacterium]
MSSKTGRFSLRVFKATYRDRAGKPRESELWYIEFRDHVGRRRRMPAAESRGAAEAFGAQVGRLVQQMRDGLRLTADRQPEDLRFWLERLPSGARDYLCRIGLLDQAQEAAILTLREHLEAFHQAMLDGTASRRRAKRGTAIRHADKTVARITAALTGAGFAPDASHWPEIDGDRVAEWLREQRRQGLSASTAESYRRTLLYFGEWMVNRERATRHPFRNLPRFSGPAARERRALALHEISALLQAAEAGPRRTRLTGPARALLYRLALETGLRASELQSLTRASFDLDGATVTVNAEHTKNHQRADLPLRAPLVALLRAHLANKLPTAQAFALGYGEWRSAEMLRADLKAAGVPYQDDSGRVADFHALRHTFVSNLARSGVHPKTAQVLARHSTIELTMGTYTHLRRDDEVRAIESLPDLDAPARREAATGTHGRPEVLGQLLGQNQPNTADFHGLSPTGRQGESPRNAAFAAKAGPDQKNSDSLKSPEGQPSCGFDPHLGHHKSLRRPGDGHAPRHGRNVIAASAPPSGPLQSWAA